MLYPEIVIAGCGNPLFADDGFGPAVVRELRKNRLPGNVKAVDAGPGAPEFVFNMLDPEKTRRLIVVDAVDFGAEPGNVRVFYPAARVRSGKRIRDAQPGGIASSLSAVDSCIDITIVGCQPGRISEPEVEIGLSAAVESSVSLAVRIVLRLVDVNYTSGCMSWRLPANGLSPALAAEPVAVGL